MERADRQPADPDLAALGEALDRLAARDPGSLADPESIQALYRRLSALDAVTTRRSPRSTPAGAGRRPGRAPRRTGPPRAPGRRTCAWNEKAGDTFMPMARYFRL